MTTPTDPEPDFLRGLDLLGVTARVKRLSDASARARRRMPGFRAAWAAGESAVRELFGRHAGFVAELTHLEDRLAQRGFFERARERLDSHHAPHTPVPRTKRR